jgi:hypothetical protein
VSLLAPRIRVSVVIPADRATVWDDLRHIDRHAEWMADAVAIRFTGAGREGVGTSFECDTRIGPLRLTDRMVVTEWEDGRAMGIRHVGMVSGRGRFTLKAKGRRATRFSWTEELRFPWWYGGPVAARLARPVLRAVWRGNLKRLRARFTSR